MKSVAINIDKSYTYTHHSDNHSSLFFGLFLFVFFPPFSFGHEFLLRLFHIFRRSPRLRASLRIVTRSLFCVLFSVTGLSLPLFPSSPSLFVAFLSLSLSLPPPPSPFSVLSLFRPFSFSFRLHTSSLNNTHQREPAATTTTYRRHRQYGTPLY